MLVSLCSKPIKFFTATAMTKYHLRLHLTKAAVNTTVANCYDRVRECPLRPCAIAGGSSLTLHHLLMNNLHLQLYKSGYDMAVFYPTGVHSLLTIWWVEFLAILRTPPHWVDIRTVILTPVVIRVIPLVKVNEKMVANHIRYRSNTDQIRVLTIYSFKLHADLKPVSSCLNLEISK